MDDPSLPTPTLTPLTLPFAIGGVTGGTGSHIVAADFDGDLFPDVVATRRGNTSAYFLPNYGGTGDFSAPPMCVACGVLSSDVSGVAVATFAPTLLPSLLISLTNGGILLALNTGSGLPSGATPIEIPSAPANSN